VGVKHCLGGWSKGMGGSAFCSVSPARCADSSLTCAERASAHALSLY
jgi:hypothetical protein